MIRDTKYLSEWEDRQARETPVNYDANMRLFEAMYEEARSLGKLDPPGSLEDLEHLFRYARAINVQTSPR